MFDDLNQTAQMRKNGAAHEDGDLLHDLYAGVPGLPRLLALTHGFKEGQQRWDAQRRSHHGKGSSCRVPYVLVHVVDVRAHGRDHGGQSSGLTMSG